MGEDKAPQLKEESRERRWILGEAIGRRSREIASNAHNVIRDSRVGEAVEKADAFLRAKGVHDSVSKARETVGTKLDEVTGARLLELLEARLEKQDHYNDVLGTRLAEALDRIEVLEREVRTLKGGL